MAEAARDAFALDLVLLAPTGLQPLKPDAHAAPFDDRLAMVELLCEGSRGLAAVDVERPRGDGVPNYTVDTLERLRRATGGQSEIFVIVGADSFVDLPRWRDPAGLLAAAQWIVVSRPGFTAEQLRGVALPEHDASRVHLLDGVAVPVSATEVRERLLQGEDSADALTPSVRDYIATHHLYGR